MIRSCGHPVETDDVSSADSVLVEGSRTNPLSQLFRLWLMNLVLSGLRPFAQSHLRSRSVVIARLFFPSNSTADRPYTTVVGFVHSYPILLNESVWLRYSRQPIQT